MIGNIETPIALEHRRAQRLVTTLNHRIQSQDWLSLRDHKESLLPVALESKTYLKKG